MESRILKLTDLLEDWRTAVLNECGVTNTMTATQMDVKAHAKELATTTALAVIKETIQMRTRKSQAAVVESRLQAQATIVEGYPKAMFHLCTSDQM
jgi:hypothetical protein